jgi:hypothetical protein
MSSKQQNQLQPVIDEYIAQLSEQELIVLRIAQEHLETSFCIEKSIGFLEFMEQKQKQQ